MLSQIVRFLKRHSGSEADLSLTPMIYELCIQLVLKMGLTLPLGKKTEEELHSLIKNYLRNFSIFKTLCEAHAYREQHRLKNSAS